MAPHRTPHTGSSPRALPGSRPIDPVVLLGRVADGDVDAFEQLHALVAPLVERVTSRVVGDRSIGSEVAQEVMLEIWIKAPSQNPPKQAPLAWVATIAHRRAIDRVRSEQAESDRRQRDFQRSSQGGRGDPTADEATERLEWLQITAGLTTLTPRQREVIELAFYQGHTYREVAGLLDIPIGTVKTRIRDALIRLRRQASDVPLAR